MTVSSSATDHSPGRAEYAAAAVEVAVAQIAQSVRIQSAEPAAFRVLSDLAGRYIEALGKAATSSANAQGRTQCNLLDVVVALEELALPRGFPGALMPRKPLLQSAVLRGIITFVDSVEEVPFAQPIGRLVDSGIGKGWKYPSCAPAGKELPPHVPRWLPAFPKSTGKEKLRTREDLWPANKILEVDLAVENMGGGRTVVCTHKRKVLPSKRPTVRFKLGLGLEQDVGSRGITSHTVGKDKLDCLPWKWENEENGSRFISPAKELCRYKYSMHSLVGLGVSSGFPD